MSFLYRTVNLSMGNIVGQSTFGMSDSEGQSGEFKASLQIIQASGIMRQIRNGGTIHLLHANCEGCEWEMLEDLIKTGEIEHVRYDDDDNDVRH